MTIGDRIRAVRSRHSLSQTEFAERLGVSLQTVLRAEKNKFLPSGETLFRLAKDFTVDLNWLLLGTKMEVQEKITGIIAVERRGDGEKTIGFVNLPDVEGNMIVRVSGEDLFPAIRPWDYAVVATGDKQLADGDIVVYTMEWGEARARRYRARNDVLISENEKLPPLSIKAVNIIGRIVKILRVVPVS